MPPSSGGDEKEPRRSTSSGSARSKAGDKGVSGGSSPSGRTAGAKTSASGGKTQQARTPQTASKAISPEILSPPEPGSAISPGSGSSSEASSKAAAIPPLAHAHNTPEEGTYHGGWVAVGWASVGFMVLTGVGLVIFH